MTTQRAVQEFQRYHRQQEGDGDVVRVVASFSFCLEWREASAGPVRIDEIEDEIQQFRRLVAVIGASRGLHTLFLYNQDFGRSDRFDDDDENESVASHRCADDVDRLFGQVLPNLPALGTVGIRRCRIPTRALQAYMGGLCSLGIGANTLINLRIGMCRISGQGIRSVAEMLRTNKSLTHLSLQHWINRDDFGHRDSCRILLDAAAHHPSLRNLRVDDRLLRIGEGTAALISGPGAPSLSDLYLRGRFTDEVLPDLLFGLRTNESLRKVFFETESSRPLSPVHRRLANELLTTYNCTLRSAWCVSPTFLGISDPFDGAAERNVPVADARQHLQHSNYAIASRPGKGGSVPHPRVPVLAAWERLRSGGAPPVVVVVIVIVVIFGIVVVAAGGDDDENGSGNDSSKRFRIQPDAPAKAPRRFESDPSPPARWMKRTVTDSERGNTIFIRFEAFLCWSSSTIRAVSFRGEEIL
jgi:hypothetical protein